MSTSYKATEIDSAYFITITIVGWVDVFTRLSQKMVIIDSFKYCQTQKGLTIFAYCLMSNHLHLFCRADGKYLLSEIMRDLKKFTSKKIIETMQSEPESRKEWMLDYFKKSCEHLAREQNYKVWQDGYHAEEVFSNKWIKEKINYVHQNPVKQKIVSEPEHYYFSSARNYADLECAIDVEVVFMG
ncbi:REP-associated tyrosine transposase [Frigoriflavimonas asaccharolytica]|uniref:REP element-mobilizing transposase RayT n=1 Tax=Frigoriflavimonas asaccharolytica TaxID=2735899 RepID=A0A8J8K699_9FLAO|nr:transposase [Frigoriflavimonas asaccharolytica]NRS93510.1 REP element-mobilizing transposase RayT [Frigoriflavimonas asaccharolytica]